MGAQSMFTWKAYSRPYEMIEQQQPYTNGDARNGDAHYHPHALPPFKKKPLILHPSKRRRIVYLFITLFALFFIIWQSTSSRSSSSIPPPSTPQSNALSGPIPNIAHFVRQMDRYPDGTPKPLHYEFRHFLAYYSAHIHLKPDSINLWSDATDEVLAEARVNGDVYTKAVLSIPNLKFHYVTFPNHTKTGIPINAYAHKSDFVRTRMMAEVGGQYFDDDAWVIKDLAVFRNAGFDNVFGHEWGGDLCQATWMSTPNNTLMRAFAQLQETVFDGEWLTASNTLITNLVKDIRGLGHDRHALLLEHDAWFPGQWDTGPDGLQMYYKIHDLDDGTEVPNSPANVEEVVEKYGKGGDHKWRRDWRNTYVVHGFSNSIRDNHAQWVFDPYPGFTPEYILSQRSNIGRALYPALIHAIENGFISVDSSQPVDPVEQHIL